ncbi:MAG TPA: zf-HC2 domain-containing protein [Bryobacteraceae bacterium]|nr:zf-HC2 domain-containing protein [Bryobacteraceae bacterium]
MNCGEIEILLADYVDGLLHGEQKSAVEAHLAECAGCAELARDSAAAVGFMERAAVVEAPPELVTRLLFEVTAGPSRAVVKPSWARRVFGKWLEPILEPRYAMSMAMTVLSFAMLFKVAGISPRQLTAADLDPVKVWTLAEDRATRVWERGMKYYESLRVVFEIQSRLKEWTEDQPGADAAADAAALPQAGPAQSMPEGANSK